MGRITWNDRIVFLVMGVCGFGVGSLLLRGIVWVMLPTVTFLSWLFDKLTYPILIGVVALNVYYIDWEDWTIYLSKYWG